MKTRSTARLAAAMMLAMPPMVSAQAPVTIGEAASRTVVDEVDVTGTVTSPRTATLSTAVAGLVEEIGVDTGARVDVGDTLLLLDAELAGIAVDRARAEVREVEAALSDAERRLDEAERVGPERGIARTEIESRRAAVSVARASLAVARAAAREQEALLERHRLMAPFRGVISERYTEIGEWVNPGDGLFELVGVEGLRFDFRIAQEYFGSLSPATPVEIVADAMPDRTITGTIDAIVPVKDPAARTFLVRVVADAVEDDAPLALTPGMSLRGRLHIDQGREGIVVSRDAVVRYADGRKIVWILEDDTETPTVRERVVRTGLAFGGRVEITNGLAAGELVVTRGNESLQDGQRVRIVKEVD